MKLKLRLRQEDFATDYAKFLAFATPFMGLETRFGAVTILEPLAPLLLWFTAQGARRLPMFAQAYVLYCLVAMLSSVAVFLTDGAGYGLRTAVAAVRQFLIFAPFILVFSIRSLDLKLARTLNDRFLLGGAIAVFFGLALHFLGFQVLDNQARLWIEGQGSVVRAGGLTGNTGAFGLQLALWGAAYFLVRPALGQGSPPWLTLPVALGLALGFYYSGSRGGAVQFVLALGLGLMLSTAVRVRPATLLYAAAGAIMVMWGFVSGALRADTSSVAFAQLARLDLFNLTGQNNFSDSGRLELILNYANVFTDNLALGIGYKMTIPKYGAPLDNAFILAFFETGVIAGTLFLLFWASLLVIFVRRSLSERWFAPVGAAIALAFIVRLGIMGAHTVWNASPGFFLIMALMLKLSAQRRRLLEEEASARRAEIDRRHREPGPAPGGSRGTLPAFRIAP